MPAVLLLGGQAFSQGAGQQEPEPAKSPRTQEQSAPGDTAKTAPAGSLSGAVTWTPLTAQQKFLQGVRRATSPVAFGGKALKAGVRYWLDPDSEYGSGASGYANRLAVSVADGSTNSMLSNFVLPCLFSQDPRYFRKGTGTFKGRLGYSISRIFMTRTDAGGGAVNWSRIFGSLGSGAISNAYHPVEHRGAWLTFVNAGWAALTEAGLNVFREFWPDVRNGAQTVVPRPELKTSTANKRGKTPMDFQR